MLDVPSYRVREAAELLGVSDDTVRRWIDGGRLPASNDTGRLTVDGAQLAEFAVALAAETDRPQPGPISRGSARNHLVGLVTRVQRDTVMAQVDLQAGPFRIVSLMSREAADELDLQPGSLAVASIKATNVVIEIPSTS
jgi:molybdopterin-binding protein